MPRKGAGRAWRRDKAVSATGGGGGGGGGVVGDRGGLSEAGSLGAHEQAGRWTRREEGESLGVDEGVVVCEWVRGRVVVTVVVLVGV